MIKNKLGITMVEILVALVLGAAMAALAFSIFSIHNKSKIVEEEVAMIEQDLVMVFNIIEKDVRNTGSNPRMSDFTMFSGLSATTLGVNYDLRERADETILGGPNRPPCDQIIFSRDTNNILIRRQSNRGLDTYTSQELARDITNLQVVYTTGSLGRTPKENNIRMVTVDISKVGTKNNTDTGKPITRSMTRSIAIRNYKKS